jgi:hypothetical protein
MCGLASRYAEDGGKSIEKADRIGDMQVARKLVCMGSHAIFQAVDISMCPEFCLN